MKNTEEDEKHLMVRRTDAPRLFRAFRIALIALLIYIILKPFLFGINIASFTSDDGIYKLTVYEYPSIESLDFFATALDKSVHREFRVVLHKGNHRIVTHRFSARLPLSYSFFGYWNDKHFVLEPERYDIGPVGPPIIEVWYDGTTIDLV